MREIAGLLVGLLLALSNPSLAQNASFSASVNAGCSPLVVNFDASLSAGLGPLTYVWDFGNGNTTTGQNQQSPGAVYVNPGTYTVSLYVTDATGSSSAIVNQTLTVYANPQADFSLSDTLGCPPLTVNFNDLSSSLNNTLVSWTWDFGDGNAGAGQNPSHTYTSGTYPVSLIVEDANGCKGVATKPAAVSVYPRLQLDFSTPDPRRTCNNSLIVNFSSTVSPVAAGYTYLWEFGDGTTSTQPNPTKTYNNFGLFDVKLRVTDPATGCETVLEKTEYIQLLNNVLNFTSVQAPGCNPVVNFAQQISILQPDFVLSWDFGDGDTLSGLAQNPAVLNPSHTYQTTGSYTVSLSVDMGVCQLSYTAPNPINTQGAPLASPAADTSRACQPSLPVNFTANAPDAVSWLWDFGDGTTSQQENPSHLYTALGTYPVSLTITNAQGCGATYALVDTIFIGPPVAAFAHNLNDYTVFPDMWDGRDPSVIRGGCLPLDITFTDQSFSPTPIVDWSWDFGDGNTLTGANGNPLHTYTTEGVFSVSLTITTADGCVSTVACDSCIRAGYRPTALLDTTGYPLLQCCSANSLFQNATDTSTIDYVWYAVTTGDWHGVVIDDTTNGNWDFGSTVPVFQDSGQYVSTTFYTYNYGCVDSFLLKDWTMLRPPYASGGIDDLPCETNFPPGGVVVFDTSNTLFLLDTAYIDSVEWTFPGGVTYNEFYPTHTFPDTGAYWIGVEVWNFDNGCSCKTSGEQILKIVAEPDTSFSAAPTQGCAPLTVNFTGPVANVSSWRWKIGPYTSTDPNPVVTLTEVGNYDVELIVANADGCADTVYRPDFIQVSGVNAQIAADATVGCFPLTVNFRDSSFTTDPVVSRVWDFGWGNVLNGNDSLTTFTFDSLLLPPDQQLIGWPVVLTVTDVSGCSGSDTLWIKPIQPIATYTADSLKFCQGDSLLLRGGAGDSLAISNLSYQWQFTGINAPNSPLRELGAFFPSGGDYTIQLTVTDSLGCQASRLDSFSVIPNLPQVDFTSDPRGALCPPLLVNFEDLSTPGLAPITQWQWDFGDGTFSSLSNPIKIYSDFGGYDVSLTLTDSLGCTATILMPDFITLTGISGDFTMSDVEICANEAIFFQATSPQAATYTWDFGDGEIGFGAQVSHVYDQPGGRLPALVLEDSTGTCTTTIQDTLQVNPLPQIAMPPDTSFCEGGVATWNVGQPGVSYAWSTGDTTAIFQATQSGTYSVRLTFRDTGCEADSLVNLTVFPLPEVSLGGDALLCEGDTLRLEGVSLDSIRTWSWSHPSLFALPPQERALSFAQDQAVWLRVSDQNGCEAIDTILVEVVPEPILDLSYDPLCWGDTLLLDGSPQNFDAPLATYTWWRDGEPLPFQTPQIAVTDSGIYEVLFSLRGCQDETSIPVFFHPLPPGDRYYEVDNCVYKGQPVSLDAGPAAAYYWPHTSAFTRTVEVVDSLIYDFRVTNEFGCHHWDSIRVVDVCPPNLYVPNAFTPNEDGTNDRFGIGYDYLDQFELKIFSRWGKLLYQTRTPWDFWTGYYGGRQVPEGVYVWVVTFNGTHPEHRKLITRSGTVTIIR